MTMYSASWLLQLQFFSSLSFMAIFFALELGLAWALFYFRLRSLSGPHSAWLSAYRFWVRVFALAYILSFAAGLVVLIQLGSFWSGLFAKAGEVFGPIIAVTVLAAVVSKSCFVGAMLFSTRSMPAWMHTVMVALVALGSTVCAAAFCVLLSWLQVPAGVDRVDGVFLILDWWQIIANPAMMWLFPQVLAMSALVTACFLMGVTATKTLRRPADESERSVFRFAIYMAVVALAVVVLTTLGSATVMREYQPIKAAALAAYWQSGTQPSFLLFGWPVQSEMQNIVAWELTNKGGFWLGRFPDSQDYIGLDAANGLLPPVAWVFLIFRAVVGLALLLGLSQLIVWVKVRSAHFDPSALSLRWQHYLTTLPILAWTLLVIGMAYYLFATHPYVLGELLTVDETLTSVPDVEVWVGLIVQLLVYGFLVMGFFLLVHSAARYGVVAVARRRGRA